LKKKEEILFIIMSQNYNRKEEIRKMIKMDTLDDSKQYLKIMLDFYFDVITSNEGRKCESEMEDDRNIWIQTIFTKANVFLSLLDGNGYNNDIHKMNPIIDFTILFSINRYIYESLVSFELLFVLPKSLEHKEFIYNLFKAHGLTERLNKLGESIRNNDPQRIKSEEQEIAECRNKIESTELYKSMSQQEKNKVKNAFGKKFRYIINDDNKITFVDYQYAYKLLNIKEYIFNNLYAFFSLHGHPSFISLIQFKDAYGNEREDINMAIFATQSIISFLSILIIDYMKINENVRCLYDKLDEETRFALGLYEDIFRIKQG
jgi:hypothetical protein